MPTYFFLWTPENIEHLAENGVSPEEFEAVVQDPLSEKTVSWSSGLPAIVGLADDGRVLFCVFEWLDDERSWIYPITAFAIAE